MKLLKIKKQITVKKIFLLLFLCIGIVSTTAIPAMSFPITLTASGTNGGEPANGMATINIESDYSAMTIVLANTAGTGELDALGSVLTGFSFALSNAPTLNLTTVAASGGIVSYDLDVTATGTSPYGWTITGPATNFLLSAGNGSWKPYGIINSNIIVADGIPNEQHNPYLMGPVTFTFSVTGLSGMPTLTDGKLWFGTNSFSIPATVPEPGTMLLLGGLLFGLGVVNRKRVVK